MSFNPIPTVSQEVPMAIRRVLEPMKDILERAHFNRSGRNRNERSVTYADLLRLGLVTEEQLAAIEEN